MLSIRVTDPIPEFNQESMKHICLNESKNVKFFNLNRQNNYVLYTSIILQH